MQLYRHFFSKLVLALVSNSMLGGCAERLSPRGFELDSSSEMNGPAPTGLPATSGHFTHSTSGDGTVISTIVDATDTERWQRLDLDTGEADTNGWDLTFRRFAILSNGGISGGGGVQLATLPGEAFETLTRAPGPEGNWSVDEPDGDDEDTISDNVFSEWYEYALSDHTLTPKQKTFLVRSTEDRFYKLRILDYYDAAGTSGVLTFEWKELEGPEEEVPRSDVEPDPNSPVDEPDDEEDEAPDKDDPESPISAEVLLVDARSYDEWTYVKIGSGVVSIVEPASSLEWDLAVKRVSFQTNSGSSGPGNGGAKLDDSGLSFDSLKETSDADFVADEELEASGAPGSIAGSANAILEPWYDYHGLGSLSPKEQTFILRTADGSSYAKLRILEYTSGRYQLSLLPLSLVQ